MPTIEEVQQWRGESAHGSGEEKLGKIEDVYLDDQTGEPEWAAIKTGMFGGAASFVPLAEAHRDSNGIHFPYTKDQVKDAPNAEADGSLSQDEEARLYEHYGLNYSEAPSDSGLPTGTDADRGAVGHDTSGPTTDDAMTRSEEQLKVGTAKQESGRVRLRKYVVTENVSTTVPVSREEVRIEREPITDANRGAAHDGPAISEEEHEVVLHEEVPVVQKETVAKERVRLDKDTRTSEETVTDEVRKEQIEVDGDAGRPA